MVTIIKNQLLKHLSRYTKNLSPEQISLSALRGSGELQDLTLDEDLLTDLLELPGWVRLTSAKCNRASFRIQWTKLKTVPIVLNLDEVHIALEVCEEPRVMNPNAAAAMPVPGKYSYIHKVIDGISVAVNHVQIDFNCDAFTSSVQISRVTVESRTPDGRKGDLRLTRIKSPDTGQLLIFKELEWQSARIEAKAHGVAAANLPPLRLLLGTTHCRIVIKKRLADCAVLGSRLVLRPEPLAWALTDGQLRAAVACAAALAGPVHKATQLATRTKAAKKIEEPVQQISSRSSSSERDILARMFAKHDVRETSYHLLAPRIDLHLCDDPGLGRSEMPQLANGGALQVTLVSMQADLFPYHKASDDRRHWRGYREAATPHSQWLSQALSSFCGSLLDLLDPKPVAPSAKPSNKEEKNEESLPNGVSHKPASQTSTSNAPSTQSTSQASPTRTRILQQLGKLMTTCLVLRIDDFTVYKVSTGSKSREAPRPLVSAEKATLPGDAGLLHAELTFFYYPGDVCFPVPSPKMYVQVSPVRVNVDVPSIVWLTAFLPHVAAAVASTTTNDSSTYMDVRSEVIMPKIVLEAGPEHISQQRDRPKEMHVCTARVTFTNVRESARANTAGTRADLASIIAALRRLTPRGHFPCADDDMDPIHQQFVLHADSLDDINRGNSVTPELLWRENRSIWCARAEPLWIDFSGAKATNYKPSPLLDATPLTAWLCFEDGFNRIWMIGRTCGLAGLQINHYQLLFLLRQLEKLSELTAWLSHQAGRMPEDPGTIVVGMVVPAVEMTLVLPTSCPGQETSSRDLDSVPLDSSSLQDLKMGTSLGSESTMAPSIMDRDSGVLATHSIDVCTAQPLPAEELAPPSPGLGFSSFSSMRRGLTSLVTSIDSALTRDEGRSDAASTASSDSERYVIVGLAAESPLDADMAFREFEHGRTCNSGVEMAAEVVERSSSPSDHSITSSCKRRDLISTCTWRLNNIFLVQQSVPGKTSLRLTADDLNSDECSSIPWDEFQSKFSMRARAWNEPAASEDDTKPRDSPKIAARLVRIEQPKELNDKGEPTGLTPFEELLEAQIKDLNMSLNMSTALGLSEFIEDEVIAPPMPLEVLISNLKLHLIEDRPTRSISSPPPQPLDLDLTTLRLTRDTKGIVHLGPPQVEPPKPQNPPELIEAKKEIERLNKENEELRKRLATMDRISEDNRELRAVAEEVSVLRHCARAAQQEASNLLADKQELLESLRLMMEQNMSTTSRGKR
ncbi:UHRF1-binding protein 1-like isoform X2 [Pieris rapae]|uniref:UHRF1-binding protein 1-like isoform X2 n=1 Tax=Pieris rapae TaxID=64459 RepID=UPI001E27FF42|nr:UHRF1-binding protein 1-like isoform X2 [Pieris rapae]